MAQWTFNRFALTLGVAALVGVAFAGDDRLEPAAFRATEPAVALRARGGMVAADSPDASAVGAEILRNGGNAFDAAVGVSLALNVVRPYSTGLGGGGFMLAYVASEQRFVALDFRETAPAAVTEKLYDDRRQPGRSAALTTLGGLAVATPGQARGLAEIHKHFGHLPLPEIAEPAAQLAERGFKPNAHYLGALYRATQKFRTRATYAERFSDIWRSLLREGRLPREGATITRTELAATIRLFGKDGAAPFCEGEVAQAIVDAVRKDGGVLTLDDLKSFAPVEREPLRVSYRGHEVIGFPPPSSGGVCNGVALRLLEQHDLARLHQRSAADAWHLVIEAQRAAFADRSRWLGDPASMMIDPQRLLDDAHVARMARLIDPRRAGDSSKLPVDLPAPDDHGTSHFCIVDRHGNIVSMTETINLEFGSLIYLPQYGLVLNNEMDDFTRAPGKPNAFGLVQGSGNARIPCRRPLSSMSPTIVLKDGRPVLVLGASGGPRIVTAVLDVLVRVLDFGEPLDEAVGAIRVHHQWLPDQVSLDRIPAEPAERKLVSGLNQLGHKTKVVKKESALQAIAISPDGELIGVCDPRKGGAPAVP